MWIDDVLERLRAKLHRAQQDDQALSAAHKCGYCRQPGHNKRTCAELRNDIDEANRAAEAARADQALAAKAEAARELARAMAVYGD